jgi:hypothetical protein
MWTVYGAAIDELFTSRLADDERAVLDAAFGRLLGALRERR